MHRVNVIGTSGSGKTTLARALALRLSLTHVELDSIYHQRDWTPLEPDLFRAEVSAATTADRWVIDGNYDIARDIIWARADTVIFLDLPRWRVIRQLAPRTLRRLITREELWNGNRERWANVTSLDPDENLLLWSWTRHPLYRSRYEAAIADPTWSHLEFIRLRSPASIRDFARGRFGSVVGNQRSSLP